MDGVDDSAKAYESVKVQYLAMVQGAISRMGTYSVAIKTGCIALAAALFVFMSPGSFLPVEKVVLYCVPFAVTVLVCAFFDAGPETRQAIAYDPAAKAVVAVTFIVAFGIAGPRNPRDSQNMIVVA